MNHTETASNLAGLLCLDDEAIGAIDGSEDDEGVAARFVRCWNAHEPMLLALESLLPGLILDLRYAPEDDDLEAMRCRIKTVEEAIAKAKGEGS